MAEESKKQIIIKGARENNLKNIDLVIPKNQLVVFTGVSGSGKSTLMHLLALLDTPTDGEITIFGKKSSELKKWEINEKISLF